MKKQQKRKAALKVRTNVRAGLCYDGYKNKKECEQEGGNGWISEKKCCF